MRPCVPLSYTSDGGVARICQRGRGGQYGNFCTLNATISGRLCRWHRPIPYSSFFKLFEQQGAWPRPLCPLSYASEQHAIEDLKKTGRESREKSMQAHHV